MMRPGSYFRIFAICTWALFPLGASAQIVLKNSNWKSAAGNSKLYFGNDTLVIKSGPEGKHSSYATFRQKNDTLIISDIANKNNKALYRILFQNNGSQVTLNASKKGIFFGSELLNGVFANIPDNNGAARDWPYKDAASDSVAGISLYKTYQLLKGRKAKTVIVAVIDNGFDINHEDLKDVIWTNKKEIPGNGIDDDHNGYIDDVHGWNFRSDKSGKSIPHEQSAATQMYVVFRDKYDNADTSKLDQIEKQQWHYFHQAKAKYNEILSTSKDSADLAYAYNINYHSADLIGDSKSNDRFYGSGHIAASAILSHGTHVAGIIAAKRNNGKGVDGIAGDVLIMPVIATTDIGDERDKDIANAIRYAVDNGAAIINMSFSKRFSPDKALVDEAVRYAEKKHVLIIHAAGNDGNNIDTTNYYPVAHYIDGKKAVNFITVGWNRPLFNYRLAHPYSNYGKYNVDLFAPGSDIFSTVPGNGYDYKSGSSMSTPTVTGVAALLLSYFPALSTEQVKKILLESSSKPATIVNRPDSKSPVPFNSLSVTGGIVNAYTAVKMAMTLAGKK
ncbi:S8 family serine peptidase [Mucilaginibacter ginsenosidivorans]|uniref:S8 family serine peptidase n=2 Tax=Mucilaginibacter ginsenosidivorans TaxID=398053 RepID=A0A5B8UWS8_9SPHI|nr:S8 family serine peptidase [Mucilaginibacter ginsenosidivorans]QEC63399.1 S8 family serine peptidase [Mucilaginibacter ginsenosidivorans]